jgi:hypothetical protein
VHDPMTLAFSFPPYPEGGMSLRGHPKPWTIARALYALKPWIGVDIWHVDPERNVPGQRSDDSCGWFPRNLTPPIQKAVDELLGGGWDGERRMVETALLRRAPFDARYPSLKRIPPAEGYAFALMVLTLIDRLSLSRKYRWRRRNESRAQLRILRLAQQLTLNDADNLLGCETYDAFVRLLAAAYRRDVRPWWKHPRWHVHHWQVNFDLFRNLKRMFQRCAGCGRRFSFGYCPTTFNWGGGGPYYHGECAGRGGAAQVKAAA